MSYLTILIAGNFLRTSASSVPSVLRFVCSKAGHLLLLIENFLCSYSTAERFYVLK